MSNDNSTPGDVQNERLNTTGKNHRKHKNGHGGTKELMEGGGFKRGCSGKFVKRRTG